MPQVPLADRIDSALPQTQCTRCGFPACRAYAIAIADGTTEINRCPPGGDRTIARLSELCGRSPLPLDPACGVHGPRLRATIEESRCIGCRLCIDACPVDAIIGAPKRLHVVLASLCSGCELCLAPCPVDCISMVVSGENWTDEDAAAARVRHLQREARRARRGEPASRSVNTAGEAADAADRRRAAVSSALERARARRAGRR